MPRRPTNVTPASIAIAWDDTSANNTGYRVRISRDAGSTWTQVADLAADATSHTITGLLHREQYTIDVQAYTADVVVAVSPGGAARASRAPAAGVTALNPGAPRAPAA